jgi:hypothetical protein
MTTSTEYCTCRAIRPFGSWGQSRSAALQSLARRGMGLAPVGPEGGNRVGAGCRATVLRALAAPRTFAFIKAWACAMMLDAGQNQVSSREGPGPLGPGQLN